MIYIINYQAYEQIVANYYYLIITEFIKCQQLIRMYLQSMNALIDHEHLIDVLRALALIVIAIAMS